MGPKLQVTKNLEIFDYHPLNRPLHKDKIVENSMKKHGFMPSSPIQCVSNGNGKLKVIRGHHRLDIAKRLGLPVWYVIDETNQDIFDLEASTKQQWNARDFTHARANDGDVNCIKLINFMEKHKIPIGAASALVGGESAGSTNKVKELKTGKFRIGDLKHANQVVRITDRCIELNIFFATSTAFVSAISSALRIPEFDINLFIHRLDINGSQLRKRGTANEYLDEIEALYNYGARKTRLAIAFQAKEIARQRQIQSLHQYAK